MACSSAQCPGSPLPASAIQDLQKSFTGQILQCNWDTSRCSLLPGRNQSTGIVNLWTNLTYTLGAWNIFDYPQLVLRPANVQDIQTAVMFCKKYCLELGVRSGGHGHNQAARVKGGVALDLRLMRRVVPDFKNKWATVEGGALSEDINNATLPAGMFVPLGLCYSVGQGFALHGGYNAVPRQIGITVDRSIRKMKVVLADGRHVTASRYKNGKLFWALRGAGSTLGVVTHIQYKMYEYSHIKARQLVVFYTEPAFRALLRLFLNRGPQDPALDGYVSLSVGPPPVYLPVILVNAVFSDNRTRAEQNAFFLSSGLSATTLGISDCSISIPGFPNCRELTYPEYANIFTAQIKSYDTVMPVKWAQWVGGGLNISAARGPAFEEAVVQAAVKPLVANARRMPLSIVYVQILGGAAKSSDAPVGSAREDVGFWMAASWANETTTDTAIGVVRSFTAAMSAFNNSTQHSYANQHSTNDPTIAPPVEGLLGGPARLKRVCRTKQQYDPTNFFKRHVYNNTALLAACGRLGINFS